MRAKKRRAGRAIRKRARRRRRWELLFKVMGVRVEPWQLDWLVAEPIHPIKIQWRRSG